MLLTKRNIEYQSNYHSVDTISEHRKMQNNWIIKRKEFHSDEFTYGTAIIQRMFSNSNYEKKEIMDQEVRTQIANTDRNDRVLAGISSLKDIFNIPRRTQSKQKLIRKKMMNFWSVKILGATKYKWHLANSPKNKKKT